MPRKVRDYDGNWITVPEPNDEAPVPTLADVLGAGNKMGSDPITSDPSYNLSLVASASESYTSTGGNLILASSASSGGWSALAGGDGDLAGDSNGGDLGLAGGVGYDHEANPVEGASITLQGGVPGSTSKVKVFTSGGYGNSGNVLTSDGTYATWETPSVPTLADVLAAGNDAGGTSTNAVVINNLDQIIGSPNINPGTTVFLAGGASVPSGATGIPDTEGAHGQVAGGDAVDGDGTHVYYGSVFDAGPGTPGGHGKASVYTNNTLGNSGDVLTSDGTYAVWNSIVTTASSSPVGGSFTSPLIADTTNKNLYAWTGSDYTKIGDWS